MVNIIKRDNSIKEEWKKIEEEEEKKILRKKKCVMPL